MISKLENDNINADRNKIINKVNELIDFLNKPAVEPEAPAAPRKRATAKKSSSK